MCDGRCHVQRYTLFLHELGMLANTAGASRIAQLSFTRWPTCCRGRYTDRLLRAMMVDRVVEEFSAKHGAYFLVDARSGELRSPGRPPARARRDPAAAPAGRGRPRGRDRRA